MKKLIIKRFKDDGKQTQGRATLFNGTDKLMSFVTLEPPWLHNAIGKSCIPPGIYTVKPRWSPKYNNHFIIEDTLPRKYILFHIGNFRKDSTGCILVGNAFVDLNKDGEIDISASGLTMKKLLRLAPDGFELEITGVK